MNNHVQKTFFSHMMDAIIYLKKSLPTLFFLITPALLDGGFMARTLVKTKLECHPINFIYI